MSQSLDPFYQFIEEYEKGNFLKAFQFILSHPNIHYDSVKSEHLFFRFIINYTDACVFEGALEASLTNQVLTQAISADPQLKIIYDEFLTILKQEDQLIQLYYLDQLEANQETSSENEFVKLKEGSLNDQQIENFVATMPAFYQSFLLQKLKIFRNWKTWNRLNALFVQSLALSEIGTRQPWHVFSYLLELNPLIFNEEGEIPVIFLEPLTHMDYAKFFKNYQNRPMLLVVENMPALFQLMQFEDLFPLLISPHASFYLLDYYPQAQFESQKLKWEGKTFKVVFLTKQTAIEEALNPFLEALSQSLSSGAAQEQFNWLYAVARRLIFRIKSERYDRSRCLALSVKESNRSWYDSHKGRPLSRLNLGPLSEDYKGELIKNQLRQRQIRPFQPQTKIRLLHVVPQLVDGSHAPSRLLRNLVFNADLDWFDVFVLSSEYLNDHPVEYPINLYHSASSLQRAARTIQELERKGIKFFMVHRPTYESTSDQIVAFIKQNAIDVVVFHGPDEINLLTASLTDAPIRVFFDHGTLPIYPCFDLLILSTQEAFNQHHKEFSQQGMVSRSLFFSIDVRESWLEKPYTKQELGFSPDSFLITTISNHLDNRLSLEMCQAIVDILHRVPRAIYAPIGPVRQMTKFKEFFNKKGVEERVVFLGHVQHPSQYARTMDLYLNEFPFGSGLAILEAMAAGCPIVSMYDEQGPQQARYAATYFGIDRVIKSGKVIDYVNLACRLIEDPHLYQEWSEEAKKQYAKRVDVKSYVKSFEQILEEFINHRNKNP